MPEPLPLPPPPLPDRPAPRRWPGYVALAVGLLVAAYVPWQIMLLGREVDRTAGPRAVLDAQAAAWNRGDLDAFMAGYWEDERLTFSSGGTVTRGWRATRDRYRAKYQAGGKEMGTLTFSDLEVEPLAADAAFVRGRWGLVFATSAERPGGVFTLVMRKLPAGWKVVHDHTSAAEPAKKN